MELSSKSIRDFNDQNQEIFRDVKIKGTDLYLNGSFPNNPWAGDIDLYTQARPRDLPRILRSIKDLSSLEVKVWRYKIGNREFKTLPSQTTILTHLEKAPEGKKWFKYDVMIFTGSTVEEATMIYDFGEPLPHSQVRQNILADCEEFYRAGNVLKALKRYKLLLKDREELAEILRSTEIGEPYLARVRANNLQIAKSRKLFPKDLLDVALGNLRQDIRVKLGYTKQNVSFRNLSSIEKAMDDLTQSRTKKMASNFINDLVDVLHEWQRRRSSRNY